MVVETLSRTLVTGAHGMVGSYVDFGIKKGREELDITNVKTVEKAFNEVKPKCVLHLAAETDLDLCAKDPIHAYNVNVIGTFNIAKLCSKFGSKMVYISTANVFDGNKKTPYTEDDVPNPVNLYGRTKLLGEMVVRDIVPNSLVVRTCWLFGGGPDKDKKFVATIIRQLENNKQIRVVADKFGSPTFAKDLVNGIKFLIEKDERGIVHLANTGVASRYDIAKEIVETLDKDVKVMPVKSSEFGYMAARANSEYLSSKLNIMRPWKEALREYLEGSWKDYFEK